MSKWHLVLKHQGVKQQLAAGSGEVVAVLHPGHHGGHQLLQLLGSLLADLQHLLVVGLLLALVVHHRLVGDERQRKGAHAAVARDDDLVHGAHACRREENGDEDGEEGAEGNGTLIHTTKIRVLAHVCLT